MLLKCALTDCPIPVRKLAASGRSGSYRDGQHAPLQETASRFGETEHYTRLLDSVDSCSSASGLVFMADVHLTNINEQVLSRLRERAHREGTSLEKTIRSLLEQAASEEEPRPEEPKTLRMPPSDRSFRDVNPVETPGISASELLIRDRRR